MLKTRSFDSEILDNLSLSGNRLHSTLATLERINKHLGNTSSILKSLKSELQSSKSYTIIDLGCGGGDVLRAIGKWSTENNLQLNLIGIDGNQNTLDYAKNIKLDSIHISYRMANIFDPNFNLPSCDILISSHFMYHFTDDDLVRFINLHKSQIKRKIIFSELKRSALSYLLFTTLSRLLLYPKMIRKDGQLAIKRSFRRDELGTIFSKLNDIDYSIKSVPMFRWICKINT